MPRFYSLNQVLPQIVDRSTFKPTPFDRLVSQIEHLIFNQVSSRVNSFLWLIAWIKSFLRLLAQINSILCNFCLSRAWMIFWVAIELREWVLFDRLVSRIDCIWSISSLKVLVLIDFFLGFARVPTRIGYIRLVSYPNSSIDQLIDRLLTLIDSV